MFCRAFAIAIGVLVATALSGCGGDSTATTPLPSGARMPAGTVGGSAAPAQAQSRTVDVNVGRVSSTAVLPLANGVTGSITLHATDAPANARLELHAPAAAADNRSMAGRTCPSVPPIILDNPFPHPITVRIERFKVTLPCSVNGLLFGASVYQSNPLPAALVSTKLGDATGTGNTVVFTPAVTHLTFPAKTALSIAILQETSTAFVPLPAIPNVPIGLTANAASTVPNTLSVQAPTVQGATLFQSACYLPNDPAGPGLAGTPILGTPAFYCVLLPGQTGTNTNFGAANSSDVVKFMLGPNVKPDRSYVGLDGPAIYAGCTPMGSAEECDSPPFNIPVYSKAIVGNDAEIEACVPPAEKADCNGAAGNPKAPSATSVKSGREFQLLFADDPTYNAPNTFGGVTLHVVDTPNWPCAIKLGPDDNADAPPGYSDPGTPAGATPALADFAGVGPNVEFDLKANWPGTCQVNLTEDTGLKRTFAFSIAGK